MIGEKDHKKDQKSHMVHSWLNKTWQAQSFGKKNHATVVISEDEAHLKSRLKAMGSWRNIKELQFETPLIIDGSLGPVLFVLAKIPAEKNDSFAWPTLDQPTAWAIGRFQAGESVKTLEAYGLENLEVHFHTENEDLLRGFLCGLEISSYSFKGRKKPFTAVRILKNGKSLGDKDIQNSMRIGWAVNWARHLVNLPPNELSPKAYADLAKSVFSKKPNVTVEIWDEKKLAQEKCNLHLGVGLGSDSPPRLVILKYRSPKASKKQKPIALVGKGVTFDTGGLDLKPPQAMRLMKKDMGGSASVFGVFHYIVEEKLPLNLDVYLALAENSVSSKAFRPSDLLTARNGKVIEIHNTDAEGRLVLADALDVATTQKGDNQPEMVIDVATLTGAIKVALGSQLAGLFSNNTELSKEVFYAFTERGDYVWPMPLYQKYRSQMNSSFADMTNAVDGFGGAVTAALFLESFVNEVPWAHLDIYAWKDAGDGAFLEPGGSGQAVQGLIQWLHSKTKSP